MAVAAREIILCGGVINSPQLLMLSGLGDPDHLKSNGIAINAALPGVGANLQDHISASAAYQRKDPGPLHHAMRADRIVRELGNAYFRGRGIATDLPAAGMAFLKSDSSDLLPEVQLICVAAPMTAHPYLLPFRKAYDDGFAIRAAVLRPESRGSVRLASNDPAAAPIIVQNFLARQRDLDRLRAGLRIARHVGSQEPLRPYVGKELSPRSDAAADLDQHIQATGISVHHPIGTCKMGTAQDDMAVVDDTFRVRGVEALRVVDASTMPDLVGGNINAAVIMMAEKAADMIRGRDNALSAAAPV
jgi:choline dehydrogenase/4-pyridoxate dehydrogenase